MNTDKEFNPCIIDSPDELVIKLQEKCTCKCYLKTYYKIDMPLKDSYDVSTQHINDCTRLMNNMVSTTVLSAPKIKKDE